MTHRLALGTAFVTYLLLLAGGLVHSTGSSLACPDWPLCYGMFFPPMVGNIRFEHGHRLIAGTVGLLTAITAYFLVKRERRSLRTPAILAVSAVVLQIILGGLTVIFLLPDLVSTAHLAVGTAFFSLLVLLCVRTAPGAEASAPAEGGRSRREILTATAIVYLQMVLGALVRHTESGLACPSVPFCAAGWFPPLSTPAGLQMLHRYSALIVLAAVGWMLLSCRRSEKLRGWALATSALAVVQILLGIFSVLTQLSLWSVMAHLGVAEAMLMCLVVMCAKTTSWPDPRRESDPAAPPKSVWSTGHDKAVEV